MDIPCPNKFKIDIKKYKIICEINRGGFGSVFKIKDTEDKDNDVNFAAKIINNSCLDSQNKKMINREIGIMIRAHHLAIIKFIGYSLVDFDGKNNVTIIMQLAENGSLAETIAKCRMGNADHLYDNTARQKILIGIARGMMYLHQHHIIHRDLKPGNILLDGKFNPLITDFGLSKMYDSGNSYSQSQSCGTSIYMAPEVISGNQYNGKADVYSFGILMFEVVTDEIPYPDFQKKCNAYQFNQKIINEDLRPTFSYEIKPSIRKLIERCWSKDPSERPTFEEIFNKLSFNIENSIYDICDTNDEPEKYYLEGVDQDEVVNYAYLLIDSEDSSQINSDSTEILENKLNSVQNQMAELMNENNQLKKQINEVIMKEIVHLRKENDELKEKNEKMMKTINDLVKNNAIIVMDNEEIVENEVCPMNFDYQSTEKVQEISGKARDPSEKVEQSQKEDINQEGKLTISKFNSLSLEAQQLFIKKIIDDGKSGYFSFLYKKSNPLFDRINNILCYIKKFVPNANESHCFSIATYRPDEALESMRLDQQAQSHFIMILADAVELMHQKNSLDSKEFISFLRQFDRTISIEIRYPSDQFQSIFQTVLTIKEKYLPFMRITILIADVDSTDDHFQNNKDVQYVTLRKVKSIGPNTFLDCSNLIQAIIPNTVTSIGSSSFCCCSSMNYLGIPDSVTSIGKSAFECCSSIKYAEIPPSVTEIGNSAFESCTSLRAIKLPHSLQKIEGSTFCVCSSLQKIEIPPSVVSIGSTAFCECTSLKSVLISPTLKSIGRRCFYRCSSIVEFAIPESVSVIEVGTFEGCFSLKEIIVPESIVSIESHAFKDCTSLEHINIPSKVTSIEESTFMNCSSLKLISTPSGLSSIKDSAFSGCSSLEQINIPTAMTSIGKAAFDGCSSLKSIFLPNSVKSVGDKAFNNCSSLVQIYIPNDLPTESMAIDPKTKIAKIY